jgi:hypothetical protein
MKRAPKHSPTKRALACAVVAACAVAFVACTDLFHSTDDVLTKCESDPSDSLCPPRVADAGAPMEAEATAPDFCTWTSAVAQQTAAHACAWLGACQTPLGRNGFGACMFQAMLAYDCAANPSHRVTGETYRLWACLASVQTCDDVSRCVLPGGSIGCQGSGYVTCAESSVATGSASTVRVECSDAGAHAENCALWGEACNTTTAGGVCGAGGATACSDGGAPSACSGSALTCSNGEIAFDCAGNGSRACTAAPVSSTVGLACVPNDAAAGEGCTPDAMATCTGGVASSCPTGIPETIHCGTLLGVGDTNAACTSGPLGGGFDWTSPCALTPPECTADACGDGGSGPSPTLVGCVRGAATALDCAGEGLGPCRLVPTNSGAEARPACTPP